MPQGPPFGSGPPWAPGGIPPPGVPPAPPKITSTQPPKSGLYVGNTGGLGSGSVNSFSFQVQANVGDGVVIFAQTAAAVTVTASDGASVWQTSPVTETINGHMNVLWCASLAAANPTVTITITGSPAPTLVTWLQIVGANPQFFIDGIAGAISTAAVTVTPSLLTSSPGDLILVGASYNETSLPGPAPATFPAGFASTAQIANIPFGFAQNIGYTLATQPAWTPGPTVTFGGFNIGALTVAIRAANVFPDHALAKPRPPILPPWMRLPAQPFPYAAPAAPPAPPISEDAWDFAADEDAYFESDDTTVTTAAIDSEPVVPNATLIPAFNEDLIDQLEEAQEDINIPDAEWSGPIQPNAPPVPTFEDLWDYDGDLTDDDDYPGLTSDDPVGPPATRLFQQDEWNWAEEELDEPWDDYLDNTFRDIAARLFQQDEWWHEPEDPADEDWLGIGQDDPVGASDIPLAAPDDSSQAEDETDEPWEDYLDNTFRDIASRVFPQDDWWHEPEDPEDNSQDLGIDDPVGPDVIVVAPSQILEDDAALDQEEVDDDLIDHFGNASVSPLPVEDPWDFDTEQGEEDDIFDHFTNYLGPPPQPPEDPWDWDAPDVDEDFSDTLDQNEFREPATRVFPQDDWIWAWAEDETDEQWEDYLDNFFRDDATRVFPQDDYQQHLDDDFAFEDDLWQFETVQPIGPDNVLPASQLRFIRRAHVWVIPDK